MSQGHPSSPGGHSPVSVVGSVAESEVPLESGSVVALPTVAEPFVALVVAMPVSVDIEVALVVGEDVADIVELMPPSLPDDDESVSVSVSVPVISPSGAAQAIEQATNANERRFITAR